MGLRMQALEMIIGRSGASEQVAAHFLDRHAESAETAIPFTPLGPRQGVQLDYLRSRGAIVPTGNRYYVDRRAFDALLARRRRVRDAVIVGIVALFVPGILALMGN